MSAESKRRSKLPSTFRFEPEVELSHLDSELTEGLILCDKLHRHGEYIPLNDLCSRHLPENFKDNELLELVKTLADATVRIRVNRVSRDRPNLVPGTDVPYPFHDSAGDEFSRSGTGYVRAVLKGGHLDSCECRTCLQGDEPPKKTWWEIVVLTAAHVVFDQSEVENSKVMFFYNDLEGNAGKTVTLDGCWVGNTDVDGDSCVFTCVSHDDVLAERLKAAWLHAKDLRDALARKHQEHQPVLDRPLFILSNPHGRKTQVSFGTCVEQEGEIISYDAITCPGSSGGMIWRLGGQFGLYPTYPHSGCVNAGISRSGHNVKHRYYPS